MMKKAAIFSIIVLMTIAGLKAQDNRELVVIDASMKGKEALVNSLKLSYTVMVLPESNNQLKDLTDSLKNFRNLKAMHLIVCGADGKIMLNGSLIDNQSLADLSEDLSKWNNSFSEDADLLIYTCKLANSGEGKLVVRRLSAITGLDVAASVNDTGSMENADLDLEFRKGIIETASCFGFGNLAQIPERFQRETSN